MDVAPVGFRVPLLVSSKYPSVTCRLLLALLDFRLLDIGMQCQLGVLPRFPLTTFEVIVCVDVFVEMPAGACHFVPHLNLLARFRHFEVTVKLKGSCKFKYLRTRVDRPPGFCPRDGGLTLPYFNLSRIALAMVGFSATISTFVFSSSMTH